MGEVWPLGRVCAAKYPIEYGKSLDPTEGPFIFYERGGGVVGFGRGALEKNWLERGGQPKKVKERGGSDEKIRLKIG